MCIICQQWEREKLTSKEAFRAIGEILHGSKDQDQIDHLTDLSEKILQKEVPPTETNEEVDQAWWNSTHEED